MKSILITGGTTALALKLKMLLKNNFTVILGASGEIPLVLADNYLVTPNDSSISFAHEMLKLSLDHGLHYILPLFKEEIEQLSKNHSLFTEYGITILVPNTETLKSLCYIQEIDKSLSLLLLENGYDHLQQTTTDLKITGLGVRSDMLHQFTLVAY